MDTRNALGIASPQDRQFARQAKSNVEGTTAYQNLKNMLTIPVDQVSDLYAILSGSGGQQEADNVVRRVGEGLMGMGLFTKNGVPHNDPAVVQAYRRALHEEFSKAGKDFRTYAKEYPDYTNLELKLMKPDGTVHVMGDRQFVPEGIHDNYLASLDQNTPSGLLPILYPAEGDFIKRYGGEIWSTLDGEKTKPGWIREHPDAINTKGNEYRAKYSGIEDFPLMESK